MPKSNYENISKAFIKHLYCKGKLSMRDTLIRFAQQGYDVNGSSSPVIDDRNYWQEWTHLSIGVEHLFEFHTATLGVTAKLNTQIEPVFDGLPLEYKYIYHLWVKGEMPECDGCPTPSWIFSGCSQRNKSWEMLYDIPFRFSKGYRKKYPHNINHLHHLDW